MNIQINFPSLSTHKLNLSVVFGLIILYTIMHFFDYFEKNGKIKPGMRVEGKFGPFIPNPDAPPGGKSCRICSNAAGVIVRVDSAKKWLVKRN